MVVQWRVRWLPPALVRLSSAFLALPFPLNRRVAFYNLLSRVTEASQFSYAALFKVLGTALATGELRLPEAVVEGTAEFEFAAERDARGRAVLVRHAERVGVLPVFKRGAARNRRVAGDVVLFLEAREPPLSARSLVSACHAWQCRGAHLPCASAVLHPDSDVRRCLPPSPPLSQGRRPSGVTGVEWDERLREELQLSQARPQAQHGSVSTAPCARRVLSECICFFRGRFRG